MKYTIISTYPEKGSQNIGDKLITNSTINVIKFVKGDDCEFEIVWRKANWEEVKDKILKTDAIIFACLAIRPNLGTEYYPFLSQILDSKIPFGIIAAGTSLNMNNASSGFYDIDEETLHLLKRMNDNSLFFTTRGVLTQSFCLKHNLNNVNFSGDIAFFDKRYRKLTFESSHEIKKIAISDPHYSKDYLKSFKLLINEIKNLFPKAEITCMLHGVNRPIEEFCKLNGLKYSDIYKDSTGLDEYDRFDLHVGYRVHAHVSSLLRRKYSYLLEQDGRGADYGLSLRTKCTVASFFVSSYKSSLKNNLKKIINRPLVPVKDVFLDPVFQIVSMINEDSSEGFKKFQKVDNQILEFNKECCSALSKLP